MRYTYSKTQIIENSEILNLVRNIILLPKLLNLICIRYDYNFINLRTNHEEFTFLNIDRYLYTAAYDYFEYEETSIETFNPEIHDMELVNQLFFRAREANFYHCNPIASNICVFNDGCLFKNFELSFLNELPLNHPFVFQELPTTIYIGRATKPDLENVEFYDSAKFSEDMILNYTKVFLGDVRKHKIYSEFHNSIARYNFNLP